MILILLKIYLGINTIILKWIGGRTSSFLEKFVNDYR
jgi:hypothetical protein